MTHPMFALSLGFGGVILATQIAYAEPQCGPREAVTALLADRYGETRRAMGIAGTDAVMELYAGSAGSWTITITLPDGQTCLVASGVGFEAVEEDLPARGEKI